MGSDRKHSGRKRPANDNWPPYNQDDRIEADASERLDAMVRTIARLIGRRMARGFRGVASRQR